MRRCLFCGAMHNAFICNCKVAETPWKHIGVDSQDKLRLQQFDAAGTPVQLHRKFEQIRDRVVWDIARLLCNKGHIDTVHLIGQIRRIVPTDEADRENISIAIEFVMEGRLLLALGMLQ